MNTLPVAARSPGSGRCRTATLATVSRSTRRPRQVSAASRFTRLVCAGRGPGEPDHGAREKRRICDRATSRRPSTPIQITAHRASRSWTALRTTSVRWSRSCRNSSGSCPRASSSYQRPGLHGEGEHHAVHPGHTRRISARPGLGLTYDYATHDMLDDEATRITKACPGITCRSRSRRNCPGFTRSTARARDKRPVRDLLAACAAQFTVFRHGGTRRTSLSCTTGAGERVALHAKHLPPCVEMAPIGALRRLL